MPKVKEAPAQPVKAKVGRKKGSRSSNTLYNDMWPVQAYQLAKTGLSNTDIAKALGATYIYFCQLRRRHPALDYALVEGRKGDEGAGLKKFSTYLVGQLPKKLRRVWKRIIKVGNGPNAIARLDTAMEGLGRRGKQHLLIHALYFYNFNAGRALKSVGITLKQFNKWRYTDPDFAELLEEMEFHQQEFYKSALHKLVKRGIPSIVKFVNETSNEKFRKVKKITKDVNVNVSGQVDIRSQQLVLDDMDIPLEYKKKMLEKMRQGNGAGNQLLPRQVVPEIIE